LNVSVIHFDFSPGEKTEVANYRKLKKNCRTSSPANRARTASARSSSLDAGLERSDLVACPEPGRISQDTGVALEISESSGLDLVAS